ncbi:MAG: hypothetical protein NC206_02630 [Bacteroides sp.]|nr:hypothetical protein [Roseburia sp.]MCM1345959.1 hypothetical protein [Bacteroides sp.]MCM1420896.1 hypothetical protein [Bacteroides sp.]
MRTCHKYIPFIQVLAFLFSFCELNGYNYDGDKKADTDSIIAYIKHAMLFNIHTPQEKVYLHFDNTGYFKGERIWYKAYVVRTDNGKPTDISRVLYVELVNQSGDIVETQKLRIEDGEAHGDFLLKDILNSGFYEVRAYTRYMTNWGSDCAFSRVFPVFRAPKTEGDFSDMTIDKTGYRRRLPDDCKTDEEHAGRLNVTFYPEGGGLVDGIESRVAFTVTNPESRQMDARGVLTDADGHVVDSVCAVSGRGIFRVKPSNCSMHLVLSDEAGHKHTFSLPASATEGCVLSVDAVCRDSVTASFRSSASIHGRLLGYVLMHEGNILECDTLTATEVACRSFDRMGLPEGVSQFTVFDSSGRILAERLFFVCHATSASEIEINPETEVLSSCGKVSLSLTSSPDASVSLSVMDVSAMPCGKRGDIRTWMLLSSEVKGYIDNPEYYFEADDEVHRMAADTLMMVQGWRRYDWRLMTGQRGFERKVQPIEDKLYILGKISGRNKNEELGNIKIEAFLYNAEGASLTGVSRTLADGSFRFEPPDITNEWNLILKTSDGKKKKPADYIVGINRNFSPERRALYGNETRFADMNHPNIRFSASAVNEKSVAPVRNENILLPEIKIRGRYFTNDSYVRWNDERTGAYKASIFYNCDEVAEQMFDNGESVPCLLDWLKQRNSFFAGETVTFWDDTPSDIVFQNELLNETDPSLNMSVRIRELKEKRRVRERAGNIVDSTYNIYKDGLSYKGRPVIWIVDNKYCRITNMKVNQNKDIEGFNMGVNVASPLSVAHCNSNPKAAEFPEFIDEVKSVYISEDPNQYNEFIMFAGELPKSPVTVFLYTHKIFTERMKGQRRTHFQGFNIPAAFRMEDYSVLPSADDFRRTIYWNPDVRTDKDGKATVEFYNNSRCKQMYVSAEGVTKDGQFVVNE